MTDKVAKKVKRLYVCRGCGTRREFECRENVVKPVAVAFCTVCGKWEDFVMLSKVVKDAHID